MPDNTGRLSEDEIKKIDEWFKAKWNPSYACPISGHTSWQIGEHLVVPPSLGATGIALSGPVYPQVMVLCSGCGFTLFFNAVLMGIWPSAGPPQTAPKVQEEAKPATETPKESHG